MGLRFLMDVHVPRAITLGLRLRGVTVITAQEDGSNLLDDRPLLERAKQLGCVLFSQDTDLLREATSCQKRGELFLGVVYARQQKVSVGLCVEEMELLSKVLSEDEMLNKIVYLPL